MALHHLATQSCWPRLSCHSISSNPTSCRCNQSIQFTYDPKLRHHIIGQAFISNVACVWLCKCTNMKTYITSSQLLILTKHILTYQHNNSTFTSYITLSQGSDHSLQRIHISLQWNYMLAVARAKLAAATYLNIEKSSTRAYSLQWEPILLQWVLSVSTNQSTNPNQSLLIAARTNLAAASTHGFDQPSHITICVYQQNQFITKQIFASL